jgi:hypothetical protein
MRKRLVGAIALLLGGGVATFLLVEERRRDREQLESHTVTEAVRRVARLATVEMNVSNWQLRRDKKPLLGFLPIQCEKTVAVLYKGKVAAGLDLDGAAVDIVTSPREKRVTVDVPAPRLMYVDVPPPSLVVADGSVCNRLDSPEYARIHEEARRAIEREALDGGILRRAESNARLLLEEIARPLGYTVELRLTAPPVSTAARL